MKKKLIILAMFILLMIIAIPSAMAACSHPASAQKWVVTKSATCTTAGWQVYKCTACGVAFTGKSIPATGHKWQDATCTAPKKCTKCGITTGTARGHARRIVVAMDLDKDFIAKLARQAVDGNRVKRFYFLTECDRCHVKKSYYYDSNPGYKKGDYIN